MKQQEEKGPEMKGHAQKSAQSPEGRGKPQKDFTSREGELIRSALWEDYSDSNAKDVSDVNRKKGHSGDYGSGPKRQEERIVSLAETNG